MKKFKITILIILVFVISTQLMITTSADDPPLGSITLHKYNAGSLVNITRQGDGTLLDSDAEIGDGVRLSDLTIMRDVPFKITRMKLIDEEKFGSTDLNDYEELNGEGAYSDPNKVTDVNGIITWIGLEFGYYLIEELENTISDTTIPPFIVQLPMTNPTGDGFLYDVHVYPKNMSTGPDIEKELILPAEDTGSNILKWKITVDIPEDIALAYKFVIRDDLDNRLEYLVGTAQIYYLEFGRNKVLFNNPEYYTLTYDENTLEITLDDEGFTALGGIIENDYSIDQKLYVEFDTMILADDRVELGYLTNIPELDYTNSLGLEHKTKTPDEPPILNLYGIEIHKTNIDNVDLEGATFNIYPSLENALAKELPLHKHNDDGHAEIWEVTTDHLGKAEFLGLQAGTYWLVETQAPSGGYNLLLEPKEIIITEAAEDNDYIVMVNVVNHKGFILPTTGGTGTILFTIGGIVLIGFAVVTLSISVFIGGKNKKDNKIINRRS